LSSIRQSYSTEDCLTEQHPIPTSSTATTTTSSIGLPNDRQSLLKSMPTDKHTNGIDQSMYRHKLLQAVNPASTDAYQRSPLKKLSKLMHYHQRPTMSTEEKDVQASQCLILTQTMLNRSSTGRISTIDKNNVSHQCN
jgi:hypothetical protein